MTLLKLLTGGAFLAQILSVGAHPQMNNDALQEERRSYVPTAPSMFNKVIDQSDPKEVAMVLSRYANELFSPLQ